MGVPPRRTVKTAERGARGVMFEERGIGSRPKKKKTTCMHKRVLENKSDVRDRTKINLQCSNGFSSFSSSVLSNESPIYYA